MEIKMEKILIEKQGRILIPKKARNRLGLRSGEELALIIGDKEIILRPFRSIEDFSSDLKGCVKESKINPLELKKIWRE